MLIKKADLAYIIGVSLGDGNLSNPNNRAVRLRITCDNKYPGLIEKISRTIQKLLPNNKVSLIKSETYCNISCYSNKWEKWLGWQAQGGSKNQQRISVPKWVMDKRKYYVPCLRGLLETDGSIYLDRGYKMVNFVTITKELAIDVMNIIKKLNFTSHIYEIKSTPITRYTVRISKNTENFIKTIKLRKY